MCSHAQLDTNDTKIIEHAEKYRAARVAKLSLEGPGSWTLVWQVLEKADVQIMHKDDNFEQYTANVGFASLSLLVDAMTSLLYR